MQRSKWPAQNAERSSMLFSAKCGERGEARAVGAFAGLFAEEEIAAVRIGLAAFEAAGGQRIGGGHGGFAGHQGDVDRPGAVEDRGRGCLAAKRAIQLARVDHAAGPAGDAEDDDLAALDVVLLQENVDGPAIATLGHDGQRLGFGGARCLQALLLVDEIERQVFDAGGVHDERLGVFGRGYECGLREKARRAAPVAQHSPDFSAFQQLPWRAP